MQQAVLGISVGMVFQLRFSRSLSHKEEYLGTKDYIYIYIYRPILLFTSQANLPKRLCSQLAYRTHRVT